MPNASLVQAKFLVEEAWSDSSKWSANLSAAHRLLELALLEEPSDVSLLTGLGAVLCDQAKYSEAAPLLERAVELGSIDGNTHYALAIASFNINGRSEGAALFRKASELKPSQSTWQAYFDPQAH
jgi:Flp pilus assembly protein TadD